jgi:YbgC/YbaW family acyl-CoA thioester hydrolase
MSSNEIFQYKILIKESHLDSFGHVNNAVYAQLYEEARWDFITKNGFGLEEIQKQQIGPVILDLEIRFKREIKNREVITIESKARELVGNKIIILEQRMLNENGKVSSEALFTVGLFDMQSRKLIQATPEWLLAVGIHLEK